MFFSSINVYIFIASYLYLIDSYCFVYFVSPCLHQFSVFAHEYGLPAFVLIVLVVAVPLRIQLVVNRQVEHFLEVFLVQFCAIYVN